MRTVDSRQQPLFDVRSFLGEPYPIGSFYWVIEHIADLIILREDFPEVDPTLGGKEGWCPVLKSKMVLIQRKEGWSDRRVVEAARSDLRVKAALHLGVEGEPPQQGTLSRHRQQMEDLGLDTVYMQRFATVLQALELLELDEPVAVDTVPIEGAGQVRDTYNLLGDGIRRGLSALAAEHHVDLLVVAKSLQLEEYLTRSVKGMAGIDWSEAVQRREFLERLVADAQRVQRALREGWTPPEGPGGGAKPGEDSAAIAGHIDKLIQHDIEFDEDGHVSGIRQQPANDRLISLTDVDMRHGRKSASQLISGFKAQIVATLATGWILLVKVIQANRHDGKDLPDLISTLQERGFWPLAWVGDHAYGILDNHVYVADLNASGVAPAIELIARNARPGNGGRFTKEQFTINWEKGELTCPADEVAQRHFASRDGDIGWEFSFDAPSCVNCPLQPLCVSPQAKASSGRTVFFVPKKEALLREHLVRREQPEFQELLKQRWRVEQANAGFKQCGGKSARRMGQRAVEFDARLSALAHNLRKLGRMLAKDAGLRERLQHLEVVRRDDGVFLFSPIARWSQQRRWRRRQLPCRQVQHSPPRCPGTRRGWWHSGARNPVPRRVARPVIESCF